jgi:hypothetical protein
MASSFGKMQTISRRSISSLSRSIGFAERSPLPGREQVHRSRDLNLIEQLFARLKAFLRKMKARTVEDFGEQSPLFSEGFQEECKASNARLELADVSPGKGGKQPDIVGLIGQRRLRDLPRVYRPRVIVLKIRLGRRLRQRRPQILLAQ